VEPLCKSAPNNCADLTVDRAEEEEEEEEGEGGEEEYDVSGKAASSSSLCTAEACGCVAMLDPAANAAFA
jgi:hypothetical protein